MSLTIAADRHLTLSFLTSNDVLDFTTTAATYTNTPPCTVAAITPAVAAAQSGATVAGVTCAVDREWAAASVSSHGIDEVSVLEAGTHQLEGGRPPDRVQRASRPARLVSGSLLDVVTSAPLRPGVLHRVGCENWHATPKNAPNARA